MRRPPKRFTVSDGVGTILATMSQHAHDVSQVCEPILNPCSADLPFGFGGVGFRNRRTARDMNRDVLAFATGPFGPAVATLSVEVVEALF